MTGNASYQQLGLGVDAMMSGCFVSGGADTQVFHDGSFFGFGEPADVAASFLVDGGSMLAGQLQLVRAAATQSVSPEEMRGGGGYGPSPSDVTVAHAPKVAAKLAGEMETSWIHEPYYGTTWFSGDGLRDPFAAAASELSLRLRAESLPAAGAVNINLQDQSSEVSCSGLTHASSSAAGSAFQTPCGGGGDMARPGPLHFSQVLPRWSGYAHVTQQTLDEFVVCLLQDVAMFAGSAGGGGGEASCPLPVSSSSKTTSSNASAFLGSEEHAHQQLKNDLQKLLQLVSESKLSFLNAFDLCLRQAPFAMLGFINA